MAYSFQYLIHHVLMYLCIRHVTCCSSSAPAAVCTARRSWRGWRGGLSGDLAPLWRSGCPPILSSRKQWTGKGQLTLPTEPRTGASWWKRWNISVLSLVSKSINYAELHRNVYEIMHKTINFSMLSILLNLSVTLLNYGIGTSTVHSIILSYSEVNHFFYNNFI